MTTEFQLHPQLALDTVFVTDLKLSRLLLMNDKRYPWLVLVPRRDHLSELYELNTADQTELMSELTSLSIILKTLFKVDKLNVGALGNIVPQLHVHLIVRQTSDPAWPKAVWGLGECIPYTSKEAQLIVKNLLDVYMQHQNKPQI